MQNWPADRVERRDISRLIPYVSNARTHSDEQVAQIAASMQEWGWTNPVLVDEDGTIIAGHGRVLAARKLGLAEVPVMIAEGWSKAQKRAYVLADNQLALNAGWDAEILANELRGLVEWDFDMSLLGFDNLDDLLADRTDGLTDPDEVPETPAEPVTQPGDVWIMGKHRIVCGDSTDADTVATCLNGATVDIACTDPPYGLNVVKGAHICGAKPFGKVGGGNAPFGGWKDGDRKKGAKQGRVHGPARNAIIPPGTYAPIIGDDTTETAVNHYAVLHALEIPVIVLWGGNYFADHLPPSRCWLVWDKENTGSFADAELAWTNQDRVVKLLRHQWSGLIKASERGSRRVHPTQKPAALTEWVLATLTPKAGVLFDGFLGSGSALIAAEKLGIACFGMELSPAYVDVAVIRWQNFTGNKAVHEDGRVFDDLRTKQTEKVAA